MKEKYKQALISNDVHKKQGRINIAFMLCNIEKTNFYENRIMFVIQALFFLLNQNKLKEMINSRYVGSECNAKDIYRPSFVGI